LVVAEAAAAEELKSESGQKFVGGAGG